MDATPDEIRTDIEDTRAELADDVDRLAERTSPRRIVRSRLQRVGRTGRNLRERMMGSPRQGAGETVSAVKTAPDQALRQTQGNPLTVGLIVFGGGLLAASLLPTSAGERRAGQVLVDRTTDAAEPVKQAATESAQRISGETKTAAQQAAENVKQTAAGAAKTTGRQAREHARQVKGKDTK
ncbi:MAG: DUF3618 domain-containing protein [Streptosporangiales bacterium]|nr:DUF3618 domain-containing protein [Streptosporangiales bacterium]